MTDLPETMRAFVLTGHGGLDMLEYRTDWPVPAPGAGEALIQVSACGMNNTDINTRAAWYDPAVREGTTVEGGSGGFQVPGEEAGGWGDSGISFPRIQGADVCGTVVEVGADGDRALIGKRVMIDTWLRDWSDPENMDKCRYYGSEADGGYAEYTVAPIGNIYPVNSTMSDVEIASFATSYITAENMLGRANVVAGDTVLVPGASGGVGSALIQLARRRGAKTVALCSPAKADAVREIGADAVLEREPANLAEALKSATGSPQVDVVADVVGGPLWPQMIEVLRRGGRYTCAGAIAGPIVEFDLRTFYLNDLIFTGATVIPPSLFADLAGYIERDEIRPLVGATYPLEQLREAQEAFMTKSHVGNIVITI